MTDRRSITPAHTLGACYRAPTSRPCGDAACAAAPQTTETLLALADATLARSREISQEIDRVVSTEEEEADEELAEATGLPLVDVRDERLRSALRRTFRRERIAECAEVRTAGRVLQ